MSVRRGACPSLSTPMQTGDGLLVRLALSDPNLPPQALIAIAGAALRFGNGILQATSRGSLQVRGLTPGSAPLFADVVAALGLVAQSDVPIDIGPLAGLDADEIADPSVLATRVREALAGFPVPATNRGVTARIEAAHGNGATLGLGPKVSVLVDGRGRLHLDELAADIRLTARRRGGEIGWSVALGGDARRAAMLGWIADSDAAGAAVDLLTEIAAHGHEARGRDLDPDAMQARLAGRLHPAAEPEHASGKAEPVGLHPLVGSKFAAGIGLPFGYAGAPTITTLAQHAIDLGVSSMRFAPGRALLAIGLSADAATQYQARAENLGFIVDANDPRRAVAACPGSPSCASGELPARRMAEDVSAADSGFFDGSLRMHISGCSKGCAQAGPADLTLVGGPERCGLVVFGGTGGEAIAHIPPAAVDAGLLRIAGIVRGARRESETSAACLARLGAAKIAAAFEARTS